VPALALEQQVAEKAHTDTRTSGRDEPSSRVKDWDDLVLVASFLAVEASRLRRALVVTFQARGLQPLPATFPPPPSDWTVALTRHASEVRIEPDVQAGHATVAALLDPVLGGLTARRWDPGTQQWRENDASASRPEVGTLRRQGSRSPSPRKAEGVDRGKDAGVAEEFTDHADLGPSEPRTG